MTLDDIKALDKEVLVAEDVAQIISCNPHWLRLMARENPKALGFPVICVKNRVKIPRRAFIEFREKGREVKDA